ncbi:MAG: PmoA family protein, partial [Opitutia bacterium]
MKKPLALLSLAAALAACPVARASEVRLVNDEQKKQVDVLVDGKPFTSYLYWADQKKPLLSPLRTAKGTIFTRGFPLEKIAGERTDHPHHISSWFNYGNVNGSDFWNSPPEGFSRESKVPYGRVKHAAVKSVQGGEGKGSLQVSSDWILADGSKVLQQDETLTFRAQGDVRIIDRVITLTAQKSDAVFKDSKEGAIAIRVTRALEEPSTKPEIFTDDSGKPTAVPVLNNDGVNGVYLSSEGKVGEKEAWS